MAGSLSPLPRAPGLGFDWVAVGEPPASVTGPVEARQRRILRWGPPFGAILIGTLVGYVVLQQFAPGFPTWPPGGRVEIWIGVGVPVAIGEFFFSRWYFTLLVKATNLHVGRLSVSNGELHIEVVGKPVFSVTLKRVLLSKASVGEGWFRLSIPAGKIVPRFYVPGNVASLVAAELPQSK
jgi:hypothetical protein